MISLEAERVLGYQGGDHPVACPGNNGEYLYPSSVGIMVAHTDPQVEPKLWIAGDGNHQIGCMVFNPTRTVLAVTERRLKVALTLYSFPQKRQLQRIADVSRVDVADMRYSRDGALFALLADAPQCNVSMFAVDATSGKVSMIAQTTKPHTHLYRQISFCPRNDSILCASGGGHIVFWQHDAGAKTLTATEGRVSNTHVRLTAHTWLPAGQAACGTMSGEVFTFPPEDAIGRRAFQLQENNPEDGSAAPVGIVSLQASRHHVALGCTDGRIVFVDHNLTTVQFVVRTTVESVARMLFTPEWHSLLVCGRSSIGLVHLPGYEDARRAPEELKRQASRVSTLHSGAPDDAVGVCHHKGPLATIVSQNGIAVTYDYGKNATVNIVHVGEHPTIVRRFGDSVAAIGSKTGTVRFVDVSKPCESAVVLRGRVCEGPITICEVNRSQSRIMVSDGRTIAFFASSHREVVFEGTVKVNTPSPAMVASWVDGFGGFLLCQGGGDIGLYSPPFFDGVPEQADGPREIPAEQLFVNSWRMDFPVVSLTVVGVHDEALNILTHSLDKETKLYVLDRTLSVDRKDRESKALKPQLTMKDHEKRGTGWHALRGKYSISTGSDGRLVVRDSGAYQARMAPSAPSKEKRDPICSVVRHASFKGGIVGIGMSDDEGRFVTAGGDGCLIVWAVGKQAPLTATAFKAHSGTVNHDGEDELMYHEKVRQEEHEVDRLRHQEQRAAVRKAIERLRERLQQVRTENESAAEDEKVPLQDFLVDRQKSQFEEQCALAIQEMADNEHYGNLSRDYVTGIIKKECWDVMDVKMTKLRAMHADAHVFNFHERKTLPKDLILLRKLKFLRLVEKRDAEVRGVKDLEDIQEKKPDAEDGRAPSPIAGDDEPVLRVGVKSLELEALEDPQPYLYNHLTVFSRHRAIIQMVLLKGRTFSIRSAFNRLFNDLVARKRTDLIKIDERNTRCRLVLKELDEDRQMFLPGFAKDEDPKNVFEVADAEVPADKSTDPEEKRRAAAEAEERRRWLERHGSDDSADKALKAWMDGRLEKEVRTLDIRIDKPEFADDSSEKFVVPEERNEEQQRIFREYEKAVQKRVEEVNARRAALQAEFTQLQKENIDQAKKFDVQVVELFQKRLSAQQQCFEVELSQVKLSHCVHLHRERARLAKKMEVHRESISELHTRALRTCQIGRNKVHAVQQKLDHLKDDEKNKEKNLRAAHPFSDAEWGESLVRMFNKKKPKKTDVKKKEDKKHDTNYNVALSGTTTSMDPFAFVEEEKQLKSRRYADDPQYQLARMDQGEFPGHIWDAFQKYRQERVQAERDIAMYTDELNECQREVEHLEAAELDLAEKEREAFQQFEAFQKDTLREQFDVDELHTFRQGQVEVEQAPVVTDYADAVLLPASEIQRLNKLIRESGGDKIGLMRDINEKRKEIRMIEWEMEHLSFSMASLEMELRHLHTLRVTKQMQEYINGGGEDHNEKERSKMTRHMEHIQTTMALKIEDRRQQILKLKRAVKDKELENMLLLDQVAECKGLVDERKSIRDLQSSELDAERTSKLMKDMRVTRKLEDVAKAQQEEMLLLKKEIDRLRERTFPSFAVVSKRVVGNPDQN